VIIIVTEESLEKLHKQKIILNKRKAENLEKIEVLESELARLEEKKQFILNLRSLVRGPLKDDQNQQEKKRSDKSQSLYDSRIL